MRSAGIPVLNLDFTVIERREARPSLRVVPQDPYGGLDPVMASLAFDDEEVESTKIIVRRDSWLEHAREPEPFDVPPRL